MQQKNKKNALKIQTAAVEKGPYMYSTEARQRSTTINYISIYISIYPPQRGWA